MFNQVYSKYSTAEPTLIRRDGAGKVTRIKTSRADGGTRRSPFLTAPFIKIVRAFGKENILISPRGRKVRKKQNIIMQFAMWKCHKITDVNTNTKMNYRRWCKTYEIVHFSDVQPLHQL